MAYVLTAVMTGGAAATLSLINGATFGQILLNYILFGHLGMAVLALACVTCALWDRRSEVARSRSTT
jgi:hypothetical protein